MISRLAAVATAGAATALLVSASPAAAHALLRSSDPAPGARLDRSPRAVSLTFTEAPEPSLSSVEVLDETGTSLEVGEPRVAPGRPNELVAELDELPRGTFTVSWKVVSRVDGHATAGVFSFGVGERPQGSGASARTQAEGVYRASALEVFGRWLLLAGLVVLLGTAAVALAVVASPPRNLYGIGVGGLVASIAGLLLLAEAQRRAAGVGLSALADTVVGRAQLWRAGAILVADVGVIGARRARLWWWPALLGAAAAMLVHVAAGHAGAEEPLRLVDIAAQWLHLVAVGVWLGGLLALLATLRAGYGPEAGGAVKRFSTLAGVTLLVVAATGIVRTLDEVERFGQLFSTGYGRAVLAKVAGLLALATLGALNRFRHLPAAAFDRLRRTGWAEIGVGAVILAVAALLAGLPPPSSGLAGTAAPTQRVVATGSDFATTVRARLEVVPGLPGSNSFSLAVSDYDSGAPIDAPRVSLGFRYLDDPAVARSQLRLRSEGPGRYAATGSNLSLPGRWEATVLVEAGLRTVSIPLELATRCGAESVVRPGRAPIHTVDLGGERSLQAYLEPRRPGGNRVHLTFFSADGSELEVPGGLAVEALSPGGDVQRFEVRRFGPGHFVADGVLTSGQWRFQVNAARGSPPITACFEEEVAG